MKNTVSTFLSMKQNGERLTEITSYDYTTAKLVEKAGINAILVGDSLGMTMMGYDTTLPVTMEDMIELLIQQMTNNSNGAGVVDAAVDLKAKGVSVRTLAKAIGMPHNTLSYQINKLTKGKEVDE